MIKYRYRPAMCVVTSKKPEQTLNHYHTINKFVDYYYYKNYDKQSYTSTFYKF